MHRWTVLFGGDSVADAFSHSVSDQGAVSVADNGFAYDVANSVANSNTDATADVASWLAIVQSNGGVAMCAIANW